MKSIPPVIGLCLFSASLALADKPAPEPQIAGPCKEAPEIVRPIGRVAPVDEAEPQTEAIPEKHAEHKEVAIVLEDLKPVGERLAMKATLRIINPTDAPIHFTGFSETSPITKTQHWKDGKWVEEKRVLRCGTGLRRCTIAPGQSAVFHATVYAETMPTRIGVNHTHGDKKEMLLVWSGKIAR